jgi:hypothetical protein
LRKASTSSVAVSAQRSEVIAAIVFDKLAAPCSPRPAMR